MTAGGLAYLESLGPHRIRPGLPRTRRLLDALGRPESSFRCVLVAGTNGKGSTCATLSAILKAAGVRAGLYTSPHLLSVAERIRVDEADVPERRLDDVLALLSDVAPAGDPPSYFEALTVAALEVFRRAGVGIAVVEVGLGGRLDATNVLSPEVSAVTNVGADHLDVLGPTLADVSREKAGIFRPGRPALTTAAGGTLEVLAAEARRVGSPLTIVAASRELEDVSPLAGAHQRGNRSLAIALARALVPGVSDEAIRAGVAATRWPARLQWIRGGRRPILLDGAHNPDGAAALAAHLDETGLSGACDLLFGGLSDKDLAPMLALLTPRARDVVLVPPGSPRAQDPQRLLEAAAPLARGTVSTAGSVAEGLARLQEHGGDGPIIAAGSLVLAGEVLRWSLAARGRPGA